MTKQTIKNYDWSSIYMRSKKTNVETFFLFFKHLFNSFVILWISQLFLHSGTICIQYYIVVTGEFDTNQISEQSMMICMCGILTAQRCSIRCFSIVNLSKLSARFFLRKRDCTSAVPLGVDKLMILKKSTARKNEDSTRISTLKTPYSATF